MRPGGPDGVRYSFYQATCCSPAEHDFHDDA